MNDTHIPLFRSGMNTILQDKLHANVMSKILSTAGLEPASLSGKDILDAGCGTGEKSCYFAYHGAKVTSLDMSCSSISKGKKLAQKFDLKVEFKRMRYQ